MLTSQANSSQDKIEAKTFLDGELFFQVKSLVEAAVRVGGPKLRMHRASSGYVFAIYTLVLSSWLIDTELILLHFNVVLMSVSSWACSRRKGKHCILQLHITCSTRVRFATSWHRYFSAKRIGCAAAKQ